MAHKKLTAFLLSLANDHKILTEFWKDPDETMKQAGLSAHLAEIVKSRDVSKLNEAVLAEFPTTEVSALRPPIHIIITLVF